MKYFGTITDPKDLVNKEYIDNVADTKANIDGAYENMTVGNAEQLVSTVFINDQAPYTYRTSGGSADIGDREYDTLVGGTIAWNQLMDSTTSINLAVDSQRTSNISIPSGSQLITGHKYLWCLTFSNFVDVAHDIITALYTKTDGTNKQVVGTILKTSIEGTKTTIFESAVTCKSDGSYSVEGGLWGYVFMDSSDVGASCTISKLHLIDLTLAFGSTIADYIYTLETTNTGDGVAWVTKLFPQLNGGYYPYNAGTLLSVSGVSAHNMTGLNQWDEVWELGTINQSGNNVPNTERIRSKNYNPCIPGASYYMTGPNPSNVAAYRFYDINKNFVSYVTEGDSSGKVVTFPDNAYYFRITMSVTYGAVYNNDICINLSWDGERNGEYEPYKLNSYPLDSSLTLRGIPKLDANNALCYDGDTYAPDGTVTRRYGIVDLGTLSWSMINDGIFSTLVSERRYGNNVYTLLTAKYVTYTGLHSTGANISSLVDANGNGLYVNAGTTTVYIADSAYTDAATFTTAISGVYLVYELATPTTKTAEPFQSPQIVDDFGTEEYVVTLQGDVAVPVGHNTNYANNLRAKLEMAPESPSGDGDYIVRQTSGQNSYVPLVFPVDELPVAPSEDGTYTLNVTISGGTATYSWVSA